MARRLFSTSCHSGSSSDDDDFFDSVAEPPVTPGCDFDDDGEVHNDGGGCPSSSEAKEDPKMKLLMHEVHVLSHN